MHEGLRSDGTFLVEITEADLRNPMELHQMVENAIYERGERRVVIDLNAVSSLNSLMIGMLVGLHLLAYENVVVLTFRNVNERIRNVFRLTGVDTVLQAHYPETRSGERPA